MGGHKFKRGRKRLRTSSVFTRGLEKKKKNYAFERGRSDAETVREIYAVRVPVCRAKAGHNNYVIMTALRGRTYPLPPGGHKMLSRGSHPHGRVSDTRPITAIYRNSTRPADENYRHQQRSRIRMSARRRFTKFMTFFFFLYFLDH